MRYKWQSLDAHKYTYIWFLILPTKNYMRVTMSREGREKNSSTDSWHAREGGDSAGTMIIIEWNMHPRLVDIRGQDLYKISVQFFHKIFWLSPLNWKDSSLAL